MTQCRFLYNDQSIENVKSKNEDLDNAKTSLKGTLWCSENIMIKIH